MIVETVGQLQKLLTRYPADLRLVGYDGSGEDRPIDVYYNDFKDVDDGSNPGPALTIDLD